MYKESLGQKVAKITLSGKDLIQLYDSGERVSEILERVFTQNMEFCYVRKWRSSYLVIIKVGMKTSELIICKGKDHVH